MEPEANNADQQIACNLSPPCFKCEVCRRMMQFLFMANKNAVNLSGGEFVVSQDDFKGCAYPGHDFLRKNVPGSSQNFHCHENNAMLQPCCQRQQQQICCTEEIIPEEQVVSPCCPNSSIRERSFNCGSMSRMHQCPKCEKNFQNLNSHTPHCGKIYYNCGKCSRRFASTDSWHRHNGKCHSPNSSPSRHIKRPVESHSSTSERKKSRSQSSDAESSNRKIRSPSHSASKAKSQEKVKASSKSRKNLDSESSKKSSSRDDKKSKTKSSDKHDNSNKVKIKSSKIQLINIYEGDSSTIYTSKQKSKKEDVTIRNKDVERSREKSHKRKSEKRGGVEREKEKSRKQSSKLPSDDNDNEKSEKDSNRHEENDVIANIKKEMLDEPSEEHVEEEWQLIPATQTQPPAENLTRNEIDPKKSKLYLCEFCPTEFVKEHDLIHHQINSCELSPKRLLQVPEGSIRSPKESITEIENVLAGKGENDKFSCELCPLYFPTKYHQKSHNRYNCRAKKYQCTNCDEKFATKLHLLRHQYLNCERRNHECEICFSRFPKQSALKKHKEKDSCGAKSLGFRVNFQQTYNEETEYFDEDAVDDADNLFSCQLCKRSFSSEDDSLFHKMFCCEMTRFRCESCLRRFLTRGHVVRHQRFSCEGSKGSQSKRQVPESEDMYTKIKLKRLRNEVCYKCTRCYERLNDRRELTVHYRYYCEELKHICPKCGRRFTSEIGLEAHKKKHKTAGQRLQSNASKETIEEVDLTNTVQ